MGAEEHLIAWGATAIMVRSDMERETDTPSRPAQTVEVEFVEIDGLRVPREALRRAADLIAGWADDGSYDAGEEAVRIYRIIHSSVAPPDAKKLSGLASDVLRNYDYYPELLPELAKDLAEEVLAACRNLEGVSSKS